MIRDNALGIIVWQTTYWLIIFLVSRIPGVDFTGEAYGWHDVADTTAWAIVAFVIANKVERFFRALQKALA